MNGLKIIACENQNTPRQDYIPNLLISLLLTAGFSNIFLSGFSRLESFWWIYALAGAVVSALFLWLCMGKWKDYVLLAGCALLLILFLVRFSACKDGIFVLINDVLQFLTGKSGTIYLDYPVNNEDGVYYVALLFTLFLSMIVAKTVFLRKTLWMAVLTCVGFFGSGTGFFGAGYGWIILAVGLALFFFAGKADEAKKRERWQTIAAACCILMVCAAFAAGLSLVINPDMSSQKETIKQRIHSLVYDEKTNAMPEGNLSNLGSFEKSGETALTITAEQPQKFYLRGMIGEVYTGTSWEPFDREVYIKYENLFYWLHKSDFYGQNILAKAGQLSGETKRYQLTVSNVSACEEHQYLPYGLSGSNTLNARSIGDGTANDESGKDKTTDEISSGNETGNQLSDGQVLTYTAGSVPQWYEYAAWLASHQSDPEVSEYLKLEQSYREFVYENDIQITNTVAGVCNRILGTDTEMKSLSDILDTIRNTLNEKLQYNENVRTPNGKNDFLSYTLEQSKCGYSVHYATAATLMLRYYGVPARYVEGYYLSTEEAAQYEPGETIVLDEAHAHAWAEYYLDGVGWIPFEVTPGYIDEEELQATSQIIADGMGDGTGNSFNQNPLTYTPPTAPKEELSVPDLNSMFRFEAKHLISILLVLLILAVLMGVLWIVRRWKRLRRFFDRLHKKENRETITELFAYGEMLAERCALEKPEDWEQIRVINQEALFSRHEMPDSKIDAMYDYVNQMIGQCKQQKHLWKRFCNHYIFWLYR